MKSCPVCDNEIYSKNAKTCSGSCGALVRRYGVKEARSLHKDRQGKKWVVGPNGKPRLVKADREALKDG